MYNNKCFYVSKCILGSLLFSFYLLYLGFDMDASKNSVSRSGLSVELQIPIFNYRLHILTWRSHQLFKSNIQTQLFIPFS